MHFSLFCSIPSLPAPSPQHPHQQLSACSLSVSLSLFCLLFIFVPHTSQSCGICLSVTYSTSIQMRESINHSGDYALYCAFLSQDHGCFIRFGHRRICQMGGHSCNIPPRCSLGLLHLPARSAWWSLPCLGLSFTGSWPSALLLPSSGR